MAYGSGAMAYFGAGDRAFACFHAVQEIPFMVAAFVEVSFVRSDDGSQQGCRFRFHFAPGDVDRAFGTDEFGVITFGGTAELYPVGISIGDIEYFLIGYWWSMDNHHDAAIFLLKKIKGRAKNQNIKPIMNQNPFLAPLLAAMK